MSPRRTPTPSRRAFSLIEAIAAIVVMSVALPALLWALAESKRSVISPALQTQARWLAAEKLDDILADRCSASRGYAYLAAANYPAESPVQGFPGFSRSVTFTACGPNLQPGGSGCMLVEVTVGYTDARGKARTVRLNTLATEALP
jgi:Tfp pilus assembly protein PilV